MQASDQARYARQILLAGVGVAGQRRVLDGVAAVAGRGLRHEVATRYCERAGFGRVAVGSIAADDAGEHGVVRHAVAADVLAGSRAALRAFVAVAVGVEEERR